MKTTVKTSLGLVLLFVIVAAMGSITRRDSRPTSSNQSLRGLIPWRNDLTSARQEALAAHKPLFVEFAADWCPDCHAMAAQTWTQPSVAAAMQAYVPVLIDPDAHPDLSQQFNVVSIPSIFVIDPQSAKITRESRDHVFSPEELLAWLNPAN
ncbi:MAG TPA: thioredoxin family protein [Tepidisphaeraceae bacterium]|nr:thioredoxin family protein [Tepidisphaeraceae bacterium]